MEHTENYVDSTNLKLSFNAKMINEELSNESSYFYLLKKDEILHLKKLVPKESDRLWSALFELTSYGRTFFCIDGKRIALVDQSTIFQITNHENRICDNPELIQILKNE